MTDEPGVVRLARPRDVVSAADDAREVLARHVDFGGGCDACTYYDDDGSPNNGLVPWPCAPVRLARVVLALAEPTDETETT